MTPRFDDSANRTRGAAGGSTQRRVERGKDCVERNPQRAGEGRERSGVEAPREPCVLSPKR
jgi:hypothetical protein